ncbi:hypothetical protein ALC60_06180 [Trachymyrmex zeteki]|uniref:Uncharacterized protein n=1 Tax=Mycetomoellerius zeteki TaxID=64791 RepID=A0A151X3K6_9HYME|nr:hypothetical protein ALC60_06180 [Trachymyrmex zeteki]
MVRERGEYGNNSDWKPSFDVFCPELNLSEIRSKTERRHYETSSLHSSLLRPRLPSSGICTRANYPSPPLKLEQNLLRRRIGAPRPPVLPVQQPGMPPSAAELVFKRRPRLERVATLRAPPLPPSPPPLSLPPPASPPRARTVSRIAIQRREDRLAVLRRKKEREKCAQRSVGSERENEREPVRESRYGARNGDGLIRGARVRQRKVGRTEKEAGESR